MHSLVTFTSLAGTLVGAATGAVFTPFGLPFGAFAGAVLGLLSGCWTAGALERAGPGVTAGRTGLLLTAPPLVLLAAGEIVAGLWIGGDNLFFVIVSTVVAVPLSLAVTSVATPWVVALTGADPTGEPHRRARTRALLIPFWFTLAAVLGWVIAYLVLFR